MRDIVVVPCYERPEYTRLCLQYLAQARGVQDKEVWLCEDSHVSETEDRTKNMLPVVAHGYNIFAHFQHYVQVAHATYGNSFNLVSSLQRAYDSGAEKVFLVEDDIIAAPDIFEWHEEILDRVNPFVSCATALNKSAHFQINGPMAMDETYKNPNAYKRTIGPYSSHAAAFIRPCLGGLLEHFDRKQFVWRPGLEQDIHIQQYLASSRNHSIWPYVPRAYNVGVYSYHINTGQRLHGTLEDKVRALDSVIKDPNLLRNMSANNSAVTPIPTAWPVRTAPVHEWTGRR